MNWEKDAATVIRGLEAEIATLRKEKAEAIDAIKRALVAHDEGVYDVSARVLEAVLSKLSLGEGK